MPIRRPNESQVDQVDEIVRELKQSAVQLVTTGIKLPNPYLSGEDGAIVFIEDRDKLAATRVRETRFNPQDRVAALRHTRHAVVIPWGATSRLGKRHAEHQADTLVSRLDQVRL